MLHNERKSQQNNVGYDSDWVLKKSTHKGAFINFYVGRVLTIVNVATRKRNNKGTHTHT